MTENPDHDREEVPGRPAVSLAGEHARAGAGGQGAAGRGGEGGPDHEAAPFLREAFRAPMNNQAEVPGMTQGEADQEQRERTAVYDGWWRCQAFEEFRRTLSLSGAP